MDDSPVRSVSGYCRSGSGRPALDGVQHVELQTALARPLSIGHLDEPVLKAGDAAASAPADLGEVVLSAA